MGMGLSNYLSTDLSAPTDREIDHALNVAVTSHALLTELYNEVPLAQRSRALKAG